MRWIDSGRCRCRGSHGDDLRTPAGGDEVNGNSIVRADLGNPRNFGGTRIEPFDDAPKKASDGTNIDTSCGFKLKALYRLIELDFVKLPFQPQVLGGRNQRQGTQT